MFQKAQKEAPTIVNGVTVEDVHAIVGQLQADAANAQYKFRATNKWKDGGVNISSIKGFYAMGKEDTSRDEAFLVGVDQPETIAGKNGGPNPVEYLLHSLVSCLTMTMIFHAAVQGIEVESVDSHIEGDMDTRGFFGLSDDVRKGYSNIRVTLRVKSDASAERLKEMALFSPVYDVVSRSVPTDFIIEKI